MAWEFLCFFIMLSFVISVCYRVRFQNLFLICGFEEIFRNIVKTSFMSEKQQCGQTSNQILVLNAMIITDSGGGLVHNVVLCKFLILNSSPVTWNWKHYNPTFLYCCEDEHHKYFKASYSGNIYKNSSSCFLKQFSKHLFSKHFLISCQFRASWDINGL